MRITGGSYKGRILKTPKGTNTRPTQERVREAIFNTLTNIGLRNTRILDVYSGTGAYALEALSRGAVFAVMIDKSTSRIIRKNIEKCEAEKHAMVLGCDVKSGLKLLCKKRIAEFDYVFIDPPYRKNLIQSVLDDIIEFSLLANDGYIIIEHTREDYWETSNNLQVMKQKKYGDTLVSYLHYQKKEAF